MITEIYRNALRLLLVIMTLLLVFMWSVHLFTGEQLMLPMSMIALIGLCTK
jgi:hypothetical protein